MPPSSKLRRGGRLFFCQWFPALPVHWLLLGQEGHWHLPLITVSVCASAACTLSLPCVFFVAASNGDIWISVFGPHMQLPIYATAISSLAHLIITVSSPVPTGCLMTWYTLRVITRPGYLFFFFFTFKYKPSYTCISKRRSKLHQMVNTINQELAEAKQRDARLS